MLYQLGKYTKKQYVFSIIIKKIMIIGDHRIGRGYSLGFSRLRPYLEAHGI